MNQPKFMPTLIENTCEAFKQSLTSFVENNPSINENSLSDEMVCLFSQALEEAAGDACRDGLKEYIETHEVDTETVERDGKNFRFKEVISKPMLSRFGVINIERRGYYHWRGGSGIFPLDEAMGMTGRYVFPDVVEFILFGAGMLTPKDLEAMFEKMNSFKPSASLIQNIINQDGQALHNYINNPEYTGSVRKVEAPQEAATALVASFDGANLMVREPGKKRGARAKRPGKDNKSKDREKSCSYKNAMIGSISFYNSRQTDDTDSGQPVIKPNRINSFYLGRMPQERYPAFKADFERSLVEAQEIAPNDVVKILLMDGARGFWKYADKNPLYDGYIKIVDYFHAAEHLSRLSVALFGKSSMTGQSWYEKWLTKLKHEPDGVESMLRSVKYYQKNCKLSKNRQQDLATEITFFQNNKGRMGYSDLVEKGLPIGSGPVEAACKTIVKSRFCQSGMRWSIQGGQNVMNLRVIQKSSQWNQTWNSFQKTGGYQKHCEAA